MRKIICMLCFVMLCFIGNAKTDTLVVSKCDSLEQRITELERNITFLTCELKLSDIINDIRSNVQYIDLQSLSLRMYVLDSKHKYNSDLVKAYKRCYDSFVDTYNATVRKGDKLKDCVRSMIIRDGFSSDELTLIANYFELYDECIENFIVSLDFLDTAIYFYETEK